MSIFNIPTRHGILRNKKLFDYENTMREITSLQNPRIKSLIELKDPRERKKQRRCLVEGIRSIRTFLDAHQPLEELLATKEILPSLAGWDIEDRITIVTDSIIKKVSSTISPSGVIGVFGLPKDPAPQQLSSGLVLAQVQDPGNMGTLIRTAAAVGSFSVVVIEGTDPWSPKAIAASAGTIAQINVFQWTWDQLHEYKKNLNLYGLVVTGGKKIQDLDMNNSLLVVGNEAHGLPIAWQNDCDQLITLPMPGSTESLNVAIAGSIALYLAFVRQ